MLAQNLLAQKRHEMLEGLRALAKEKGVPLETLAVDLLAALKYLAEPKLFSKSAPPSNIGLVKLLIYFPAHEDYAPTWAAAQWDGKQLVCSDPRAGIVEATHWLPWPHIVAKDES